MHFHAREGDFLLPLLGYASDWASVVLCMPNLKGEEWPHGLVTASDVLRYEDRIKCLDLPLSTLVPLKLTDTTTPEMIIKAAGKGIRTAKLYPIGGTTNSSTAVGNIENLAPVFEAMDRSRMILLGHWETPAKTPATRDIRGFLSLYDLLSMTDERIQLLGHFGKRGPNCFEAEEDMLSEIQWIIDHFPTLKIVFEHISTRAAVDFVLGCPDRVVGTITPHHLWGTQDDWLGTHLNAWQYCRPVIKTREDKMALVFAATHRSDRFFLGTDSAAHPEAAKRGSAIQPGVFNTPVTPSIVTSIFEGVYGDAFLSEGVQALQNFAYLTAERFYGLPPAATEKGLLFKRKPWQVPKAYNVAGQNLVPLAAGETLAWMVTPLKAS